MAAALLALAACTNDEPAEYIERPVDELYNEAVTAMEARDWEDAAKKFDEVERQHPYSTWATKSQLMAAYAHYERSAYDDAVVALNRFLQLHPSHEDAAYAYYLRGLCYYEQISTVTRDQKMTDEARKNLAEVVTRYPNSKYARDARIKLDLTLDHLAGKEMDIGRYYLRQGEYLAAINRFREVIDRYGTTTHVPEALHRLTEAYLSVGLIEEARKTAAVLGHNFPGSEWYVDSYEGVEQKKVRREEDDKPWYKVW